MRISVPTLPSELLSAARPPPISTALAAERVADFLNRARSRGGRGVAVLTGAGVSVDSGIRAYRGQDGRYMNPNYKPILYHELVNDSERGVNFRQRYWLRSFLGYPPVRDARPNPTHYAIAALQHSGYIRKLITQNVDGLHLKALADTPNRSHLLDSILELHGTLHRVHCKNGHIVDRNAFQDRLGDVNPQWSMFAEELERTGRKPRTNPDGDVVLEGVSYDDFVVPDCPECLREGRRCNVLKPEVIFFGESISHSNKDRSFKDIEACDSLLVVGTTLATYSAFRLLKHSLELSKPVLMLNVGPSRADGLHGVEKIDLPVGQFLWDAVRLVLGSRVDNDPVLQALLASGVVNPASEDDEDSRTSWKASSNLS